MRFLYPFLTLGFLLLSSCGSSVSSLPSEVNAPTTLEGETLNSTYIEWYGRHQYQDEKMYFYHTATGLKLAFYGRIIALDFVLEDKHADIYYAIAKDGEDLLNGTRYAQKLTEDQLVVTYDDYSYHTLEVVKQSEPQDGVTAIQRITTNGYFMEATTNQDRPHFLCLGASGISGHGALGQAGQGRTTFNSSSLHSFGYLTAAALNGSYEFVAQSGWGLAFGYNDTTGTQTIGRAVDYIGIDASEHIIETAYTYETIPDYIIINVGGNDYSAVINQASGFDKNNKILQFKQAVALLLLKLRTLAPQGHIIWTMTQNSLNGTAAKEVIAQLSAEDQQYVHSVIIKQVGEDGDPVGANNHASYVTHQKSAQAIVDVIMTF